MELTRKRSANTSIVLEVEDDGRVAVKISTATWELNVRARPEELRALATIRETDWIARKSLAAGTCANALVFWACDNGTVSILTGENDETWDIAVEMPVGSVDEILTELRHVRF